MNIAGKNGAVGQYLFYLIITVFLIHYVIYRSVNLSFTHDESLSYLVNENFAFQIDTVTYKDTEINANITSDYATFLISTNTHLLNSLFMKLIDVAFGDSEFLLRLPNVLAFLCYLFFAFKIARLASLKLFSYAIFTILAFNTYLVDFFSLARGYGLAVMFMTGSIYFLIMSVNNNFNILNRRYFTFSYLFAILSCLSNLIWLYFYIAILLICILILIRNRNVSSTLPPVRMKYLFILVNVVFFLIIVPYIMILYYFNQFYFGSGNLEQGALISLCRRWLYSSSLADYAPVFAISVALLSLSMLMYLVYSLRKAVSRFYLPFIILLILLIEMVILNLTLGIPFLQDRTAMIYIPLFQIAFIFLSIHAATMNRFELLNKVILVIAGAVSLVVFALSFNYTQTFEWKHEATTRDAFHKIVELSGAEDSIIILTNWQNVPAFNYYRLSMDADNLFKIQYRELSPAPDFVYLNMGETLTVPSEQYTLIENYPSSGSKLYRLKK